MLMGLGGIVLGVIVSTSNISKPPPQHIFAPDIFHVIYPRMFTNLPNLVDIDILKSLDWVTSRAMSVTSIITTILEWERFTRHTGQVVGCAYGFLRKSQILRCIFDMWLPAAKAVGIDKKLSGHAKKEKMTSRKKSEIN